jgi:hypothetical protein
MAPLSFAVVAVLFMLRQRWTLTCMKGIAAASVLGHSFFFPSELFYGAYTFSAQVLAGVQIVACIVILWSVFRAPDTKAWFASNGV